MRKLFGTRSVCALLGAGLRWRGPAQRCLCFTQARALALRHRLLTLSPPALGQLAALTPAT